MCEAAGDLRGDGFDGGGRSRRVLSDRARGRRGDRGARGETLTDVPLQQPRRRRPRKRVILGVVGAAFALATFAYFLPKIADYRDVWAVIKGLSWEWIAALVAVTLLNLATFAPPWQVALPGLRYRAAFVLTQVSTALSLVVPGGAAVGIAGSYGILRRWGFRGRDIGRAVTLVSLWNQFANLSYPVLAVFLLAVEGSSSAVLATAAFVGAAVLGVAVAALAAVLGEQTGQRPSIGDLAAQLADWALAKFAADRSPGAARASSASATRPSTCSSVAGTY